MSLASCSPLLEPGTEEEVVSLDGGVGVGTAQGPLDVVFMDERGEEDEEQKNNKEEEEDLLIRLNDALTDNNNNNDDDYYYYYAAAAAKEDPGEEGEEAENDGLDDEEALLLRPAEAEAATQLFVGNPGGERTRPSES